jgi:hypothetical protein
MGWRSDLENEMVWKPNQDLQTIGGKSDYFF